MQPVLATFVLLLALATGSKILLTPASIVHLTPLTNTIARQYLEQDSKGFYSYGYSGDTSARAEYSALDGTSKGFYSYIDADGKLQTVKYEAGSKDGFKAEATNLPVDDNKPPTPVKDTPEVQRAKQEHFEAYREAERRAAMAPDNGADDGSDSGSSDSSSNADDAEGGNGDNDAGGEEQRANGDNSMQMEQAIDQDARARNMLNMLMAEKTSEAAAATTMAEAAAATAAAAADAERSSDDMTSYTLNAHAHLNLNDGLEDLLAQGLHLKSSEEVQVPVHSYYTLLSPSANYHVITPTTLTSVPRIESLKLGHSLPISLSSTFVSQRINGNAHANAD